MNKLELRDFANNPPVHSLPLLAIGDVLKLSKGLREARRTEVKYVKVVSDDDRECSSCLFERTNCASYLAVRCTSSERNGSGGVVYLPCDASGELL